MMLQWSFNIVLQQYIGIDKTADSVQFFIICWDGTCTYLLCNYLKYYLVCRWENTSDINACCIAKYIVQFDSKKSTFNLGFQARSGIFWNGR